MQGSQAEVEPVMPLGVATILDVGTSAVFRNPHNSHVLFLDFTLLV